MKILIHDYAGHPFQVALSRELASRGYEIDHAYFADDCGPKGSFESPKSLPKLSFVGIGLDGKYEKSSYFKRRAADIKYGRKVAQLISKKKPDVVISGNTPIEAQGKILAQCKRQRSAFIFWVQDFYGIAAKNLLRKKLGFVGSAVGSYYESLESRQLRNSDAIIVIAEEFRRVILGLGCDLAKLHLIENWAAIADLPVRPKDNPWSREHGIESSFNFLYTGTLGLKHNPELLVALAVAFKGAGKVVVISAGTGVELLRKRKQEQTLDNLIILPLQPAERFADVLASGDVLVSLIEPEAGFFSVPSKVQSYLCAERALLLSVPKQNLAARTVAEIGAGVVAEPANVSDFIKGAKKLLRDENLCVEAGKRARAYAQAAFDIKAIANKFENAIEAAFARELA